MDVQPLFTALRERFGKRSDPPVWWEVFHGRTDPPEFERTITNVLVTQTRWDRVRPAVTAMDAKGLLTAKGLANTSVEAIAECARPTGYQNAKAKLLKAIGTLVVQDYQTESVFCEKVTYGKLQEIGGIGPETADRILLYTCGRLVFPVDTYCLRVLSHYGIIDAVPEKQAERKRVAASIKQMVQDQMPANLEDWQRLHALMQLEGERLRHEGRGQK